MDKAPGGRFLSEIVFLFFLTHLMQWSHLDTLYIIALTLFSDKPVENSLLYLNFHLL